MRDRGQVSTALVEAAVGALLVLAVAALIVVAAGHPVGEHRGERTDQYAADLGVVLRNHPVGSPSLATILGSRARFNEYRAQLRDRVEAALPADYFYRIESRYGSVGYPTPRRGSVGAATVRTVNGSVQIWVWSA